MTKVKIAAAVLLTVTVLGLGTGYVSQQVIAADTSAATTPTKVASPEYFTAFEQRERKPEAPRVIGIVQSVDATKKTINVLTGRANPEGMTYEVAKDAKIALREGRETKGIELGDIKAKARVTLFLDDAKKIVRGIEVVAEGERGGERRADGGTVVGILKALDAKKNTLTLQFGSRDPNSVKETTYELAKDCKVVVRQGRAAKEAKLADLELNKPVQLRLDENKKLVQAIEVHISTQVRGLLSEVDHNKRTITIEVGGGREVAGEKQTFDLTKEFKVFLHLGPLAVREGGRDGAPLGKEIKLADVPVTTTFVMVQLDDAKKIGQHLHVQAPTMRTPLKTVDAAKAVITVSDRREDKELPVAKDATIMVNGKAGKLADLTAGADAIVVLSLDRAQIVGVLTPVPERGREEQ
jgi:hypothetical protein